MRVAETLGYPLFVVDEFPVSELERWATYFSLQKDARDGKSLMTPDTITTEDSQNNVIELFKRMGRG